MREIDCICSHLTGLPSNAFFLLTSSSPEFCSVLSTILGVFELDAALESLQSVLSVQIISIYIPTVKRLYFEEEKNDLCAFDLVVML